MWIFYIWIALVGAVLLMGITEAIEKAGERSSGAAHDWTGYNTAIFALCMIAFFPVMVLVACVKKNK